MSEREYLSTGEVSKILKISRSTVSRKFDKGVFEGKINPITGERLISRASLQSFMQQYDLDATTPDRRRRNIVLASADEQIKAAAQKAVSHDARIQIEVMESGCDALMYCTRKKPDMIVIDSALPDVHTADMIQHLRKANDFKRLKILHLTGGSSSQETEDAPAHSVLSRSDFNETRFLEIATKLLQMPPAQKSRDQQFSHKRGAPRVDVKIPVRLSIRENEHSSYADEGRATLEDISMTGARLSEISLNRGTLPASTFRLDLSSDQWPLSDWEVTCRVVRVAFDDSMQLGVEFADMNRESTNKLSSFFGSSN